MMRRARIGNDIAVVLEDGRCRGAGVLRSQVAVARGGVGSL